MSGKFIVNVIATIGWLVAAVFAYAFLALFGFFGVGFYGLLLLFICSQVELDSDGLTLHLAARQARSHAGRASRPPPRSPGIGPIRFFRMLGIGLTVIGFGGFLYFQLD